MESEGDAPDWLMLNVLLKPPPETVMLPERKLEEEFSETRYEMVPFQLPLLPSVTVNQLALLLALQETLEVTEMKPVVTEASTLRFVGEMESDGDAPDWLMLNVLLK